MFYAYGGTGVQAMTEEQEILKIEIPVEEETAVKPQVESGRTLDVKAGAKRIGQEAAKVTGHTAQKVWDSEARKSVTGGVKKGVQKGATAVTNKSAELLHEHLVKTAEQQARQQAANLETRIRETDWKAEAGKGAAAGLRWASKQLKQWQQRMEEKTDEDRTTSEK
jgi:hypothetical protein